MTIKWLGEWDECNICGYAIKGQERWFVDGKTTSGPWALMCPICFGRYGMGIKYGLGQMYDGMTGELMAGGPDSNEDGLNE